MLEFEHHKIAVENTRKFFEHDEPVLALLLAGSIAHGYATETSDVDIMIVVSDEQYRKREAAGRLLFFNRELAQFENGYVDGKYISMAYMNDVIARGNEPTRYAFKDCEVLFSRIDDLAETIERITRFDTQKKEMHGKSFYSQVLAWNWFLTEGVKHGNRFVIGTAVSNIYLFACRLILNHNEALYPYIKWLSREVERVRLKPVGVTEKLDEILEKKRPEMVASLIDDLKALNDWGVGDWEWPMYYHHDVETIWMRQQPALFDL